MKSLFYNIGRLGPCGEFPKALSGRQMAENTFIENAYVLVEDGLIKAFGSGEHLPKADKRIDCEGGMLLPGWVDCHTHIVFAAWRNKEFEYKLQGKSYAEIAAAGGGILNSVARLRETDEDALFQAASLRLEEMIAGGTTALEIKSGYGLDLANELKMLRVIARLKEAYPVHIKANVLAAHAVPKTYAGRSDDYVDYVISAILPAVASENLAQFVDVFCEEGFFTPKQTDRILKAGIKYGLKPKIHANQLAVSGGVEVGVANHAVSVDHLEQLDDAAIEALKQGSTIPVALPGCSFYLGLAYTPARRLLAEGLPVAIASDYNPGSSPCGSMQFMVSLACLKMRLLPLEAIHAATINAAYAMDSADVCGSITVGKRADFQWFGQAGDVSYIPYKVANNPVQKVFIQGEEWGAQ